MNPNLQQRPPIPQRPQFAARPTAKPMSQFAFYFRVFATIAWVITWLSSSYIVTAFAGLAGFLANAIVFAMFYLLMRLAK